MPAQQQHAASAELLQLTQLYVQHRAQQLQQQQLQQQQQQLQQQQPQHSATAGPNSSGSSSSSSHQQLHSTRDNTSSASSAVLRASTFDWSSPEVPEQFDVVLACDGEQRLRLRLHVQS
jgi:hypothetical protein